MAQTQRERIQDLLSRDPSPERAELLRLGFDALAGEPVSVLLAHPELLPLVLSALTRDNAQRTAERHLIKAAQRAQARLEGASERVRDTLPEEARERLLALVASGKGPRFAWLKGAIDPADLRQLFAPVVQQVLAQFTAKLPIPGLGGTGSGLGGLVGMLGKQVSKSASQLADVGKSVMGGIGTELERRLSALTRDFSQTAVGEFRTAIAARLASDEGKEIAGRIRDRVMAHVLAAKLSDIVDDLMQLPLDELARIAESTIEYQRSQPLFAAMLEAELKAALDEVGQRSLSELLSEAGVLDRARTLAMEAVEPGLKRLVQSDAFGDWLERLLASSAQP